jgi:hypothetical protein
VPGLVALTWLSLVSFEPPAPRLDPKPEGAPIEGPARPAELGGAEPPREPEPGIELAPPPELDETETEAETETETEADVATADAEGKQPAIFWPDPGTAPADGTGFFVGGGVLAPTAAIVTWALLRDPSLSSVDRSGIWIAGGGMELVALIAISMGAVRRAKLVKWANAYRVIPTPQGSGLLTLGGLGVTSGLTLIPLGIWVLARGGSNEAGLAMLATGAVTGGVIAPLGLSFGTHRRKLYEQTGGWRRRPIPELTLTPSFSISAQHVHVGLSGRF